MKENVEKALAQIRPSLQADGGDVELVEVKDGKVLVEGKKLSVNGKEINTTKVKDGKVC